MALAKAQAYTPAMPQTAEFVNAFFGWKQKPSEEELLHVLGGSAKAWKKLLADLGGRYGGLGEWHSYSPKAGWSLRVKAKERVIVYLSPSAGFFLASFALGERALTATKECGLPDSVLQVIETARKYAEGTAVRLEVRTLKDVSVVMKIAKCKLLP